MCFLAPLLLFLLLFQYSVISSVSCAQQVWKNRLHLSVHLQLQVCSALHGDGATWMMIVTLCCILHTSLPTLPTRLSCVPLSLSSFSSLSCAFSLSPILCHCSITCCDSIQAWEIITNLAVPKPSRSGEHHRAQADNESSKKNADKCTKKLIKS